MENDKAAKQILAKPWRSLKHMKTTGLTLIEVVLTLSALAIFECVVLTRVDMKPTDVPALYRLHGRAGQNVFFSDGHGAWKAKAKKTWLNSVEF